MHKTKVAFVDFSSNFFDRHPVYCLSAYLKNNGIQVCYVNSGSYAKAIAKIKRIRPDLLLYSVYSRDIPFYIKFDKILKENFPVKSIIGGPGPTFEPESLRHSTIDASCIGEGEQALLDFINGGFLPPKNIVLNKDPSPSGYLPFLDLNSAPFPDRELVYKNDYLLRNMPNKQFLAGRGCPYMCTYCHNNIQNKIFKDCGPIVRKKSVDYLLGEIKSVKQRYPLKMVVFQDDTFLFDKKWLFDFCENFPRKLGLPYTCNIRPDLIDEDVVKALKQSNCACVYWSIESGDDFIRNSLLKRQVSRGQILRVGRLLNKYKLPHRSGGMVGLPGEKFKQMLLTLRLNIKIRPEFGFASIFIPFPGLELTDYALKNNHLPKEALNKLPENTHSFSVLNFSAGEKRMIQKLTYLYPIFVNYPALFYNRRAYKMFFKLPRGLLYLIFSLFSGYKLSRIYGVKMPLMLKVALLRRYIKNPF